MYASEGEGVMEKRTQKGIKKAQNFAYVLYARFLTFPVVKCHQIGYECWKSNVAKFARR